MSHTTAITDKQLRMFYAKLRNAKLTDHKESLVFSFTNERTTHVKEMRVQEFKALLDYLNSEDTCEKMKRKIFAILYDMGWICKGDRNEWLINMAVINGFLMKKGAVKKPFYELQCNAEVSKVLCQFESLQKNNRESKLRKEADEVVKSILIELNIAERNSKK